MENEQQLVDLLSKLVQTPSYNPPGDEAAAGEQLVRFLRPFGEVSVQPVAPGRNNIVARLRGRGEAPAFMLCAHLDTVPPGSVPWAFDPLSGHVADGRVHGRGALDTKGSLAAMAMAFATLSRAIAAGEMPPLAGDLLLLATVDEETNGLGARTYLEAGGMNGVGAVVIGEPTSLDLVIAHRGALWVEVRATGRAAHGAMPQAGANAILPVAALLGRLVTHKFSAQAHPLLAPPTLNVGTIAGGSKTNMVPDQCRASVDMRTVPGQSHTMLLSVIRALAAEEAARVPGVQLEVYTTNDKPPLETAPDALLVQQARAVLQSVRGVEPAVRGAPYLTDGALLAGTTGIPAIVCGPGLETMAHQVNETLEVSDLVRAWHFYTQLARAMLQPQAQPNKEAA